MISLLLNGCNGKMGQVISDMCQNNPDFKVAAGIDIRPNKVNKYYKVYENVNQVSEKADLLLDFSHPDSLHNIINFCINDGIALVVATTGLSPTHYELLKQAATKIPVFQSANMSLGVSLTAELCKNAAKALAGDFDIEIIEKHHNEKKDAPSGTALMLAKEINNALHEPMEFIYERAESGKRKPNEIGICSVRGGTIPGEHTVIFAGKDEIIEIKHTALSRKIFAEGTLKAIKFIVNKEPGFYNMNDLIKEFLD